MARRSKRAGDIESSTRERIIEAARAVVSRDGWDGLTVSAVAAEAGVYSYAIHYHFGSKKGLVAVVVDRVLQLQYEQLQAELAAVPSGEPRIREMMARIVEVGGVELDLLFFETFTSALRDADLRKVLRLQYDRLRELIVCLLRKSESGEIPPPLLTLASLWLMVCDGFGVQRLIDPTDKGAREALAMFERMVGRELAAWDEALQESSTPSSEK